MIFKRTQKINIKYLFEKIIKHEHNTFEKVEINFLQAPHPDNIQAFFELYKNLSSFRKIIFFDYLKEFVDNYENKEQRVKMSLFSQSLIKMCLENIHELIFSETHTGGLDIHLFFILFDSAEKFRMQDEFKHKIIEAYNHKIKNEPQKAKSAIEQPYFEMKKKEMGYDSP